MVGKYRKSSINRDGLDGFRSTSEIKLAEKLREAGIPVLYETTKIKYSVTKACVYTPDFVLPSGVFIEVKGWFRVRDRLKHLAVKKDLPQLDVRFIFDNPATKLSAKSKSGKTYADWCNQYGFLFAKLSDGIPSEWLNEN
jgi:hypothetical protein